MPCVKLFISAVVAVSVSACATAPSPVAQAPVKRGWDGTTKIGKPYQVLGEWYYPADEKAYDQEGIASWYGPTFHMKATANGETFDMNEVSAAHKTLPLPSYVTVTNITNGRELTVRVNDRGPFKPGRIIDLSRRAAQLLGFDGAGTAQVRVRRVYPENAPEIVAVRHSVPVPGPDDLPAALVPPAVPNDVIAAAMLEGPTLAPMAVSDVQLANYFVQVAAVGTPARAKLLAADIKRFGAVVIDPLPGGRAYRIRIGPFFGQEAAELIRLQVQSSGYPEARILLPSPKIG
jgi:rare lipoprotein A